MDDNCGDAADDEDVLVSAFVSCWSSLPSLFNLCEVDMLLLLLRRRGVGVPFIVVIRALFLMCCFSYYIRSNFVCASHRHRRSIIFLSFLNLNLKARRQVDSIGGSRRGIFKITVTPYDRGTVLIFTMIIFHHDKANLNGTVLVVYLGIPIISIIMRSTIYLKVKKKFKK